MPKLHLYFRTPPPKHRYFPGDGYIIEAIKYFLGRRRQSSLKKVFDSLCRGLNELKVDYDINLPFKKIKPGESVIVLGLGKQALKGYQQSNPIIAGIGLMTHPNEWPGLFDEYPVVKYLQHSGWTNAIYARHFGADKCVIWPAGIDTQHWQPENSAKTTDILIYNKIMWNKPETSAALRNPIIDYLDNSGLSLREIVYGNYTPHQYKELLQQSRAMLFLCEHESQGFALCEALSMNVPILAWDQGQWLDPNRFKWNDPDVPATSVPFFDDRCGMLFANLAEFNTLFNDFWNKVQQAGFHPREYILENLTFKKSAERMLEIINDIQKENSIAGK